MGHFKRIHQPSAPGFLAPPAKRGERIMERGTRKQTSRSMNYHASQKLSATPPRPSPSNRIDGEGGKTTGFAEVFEIGNAGGDLLKNRDAPETSLNPVEAVPSTPGFNVTNFQKLFKTS